MTKKSISTFLRIPVVYQIASFLTTTKFVVDGNSMKPTLRHGHHILINAMAYSFATPSRGDIIIFQHPVSQMHVVKRIVGTPGEHIQITGGQVFVNGQPITETNPSSRTVANSSSPSSWWCGDDQYYVLGDNRASSLDDSRNFGGIQRRSILGKVWIRVWPLTSLGFIQK